MKAYIITSQSFDGEIKLEYREDGLLRSIEVPEGFSVLQHSFLFSHLPTRTTEMASFKKILTNSEVTEIVREVSFDDFWKRYFAGRGSDNSSKKKSRTRWDRMTKSQQVRAYNYIPRYFNKIAMGIATKLAETYLNSEMWEN